MAVAAWLAPLPVSADLAPGTGSFVFVDKANHPDKPITVWYHRPEEAANDAPVVFVMHGVKRNGAKYRDNWIALADANKFIVVVPEFTKKHFPGSWRYNMGNVFYAAGGRKPADEWAYAFIEKIFDALREEHKLTAKRYDIFGHSAGAQFVHRMVLFMPNARIRTAVAANAGWYTMVDDKVAMPYGLAETETDAARVRDALGTRLIVLLGEDDNDPNHRFLRRSSEAMAQGAHRFERGQQFFATAQQYAKTAGLPFAWRLETVPGVAHSNRRIAPAAAKLVGKAD
ncbi:MAG: hypothetical protein MJE12_12340 [Alphaproteobacteria bacterium]|nr:hypothetical protein [Alphaproteobacteria bacterium]